jgi:uncharacterized iron-regulated membrane protein
MGFWKQPQKTFLRRALFQIHLWTGIGIGLYIVFISVTGSAVVFRRDLLYAKLGNVPAADAKMTRMEEPQLREAILAKYPGATITRLTISRRRLTPAEVTMTVGPDTIEERFNQYTGADMGEMHPTSVTIMEWFVDLHDNLLKGETGRQVNAVGGGLLCLLCLSGLLIWWRGIAAWYQGFYFNPKHGWKRINFDLHAALGFWSLAILFLWGLTGVYFAFPDAFIAVVDYFEPTQLSGVTRNGDRFLAWIVMMHFGRYGGLGVRITYVIVGLLPAVLFVTGGIMWWNRVLRRWLAETRAGQRAGLKTASFARPATAEPVD